MELCYKYVFWITFKSIILTKFGHVRNFIDSLF